MDITETGATPLSSLESFVTPLSDRERRAQFVRWLRAAIDHFGTAAELAKVINYRDGSQVSKWLRGESRPDEYAVLRLARQLGEDPIALLRMSGYDEMADLITGHVAPAKVVVEKILEQRRELARQLQEDILHFEHKLSEKLYGGH